MDLNNTLPIGGTELMHSELSKRLPEYMKKYSVFNYPVYADAALPLVYWNQLSYDQSAVQFLSDPRAIEQIEKIVFVSHWQAEKFREKFNIPGYKTEVIKNAFIADYRRNISKKKDSDIIKICYTSTPWRGLNILLDAWEIDPPENCELHIFSSTKIYGSDFSTSEDHKYHELYERATSLKGVVYRGNISNELLRKELTEFDILAYPCTFEETSCISVIEALSAGLRVITSNIGALPETTEGWARMYPFYMDDTRHANIFSNILKEEIELFRSGDIVPHLRQQLLSYAPKWNWDEREKDWIKLFKKLDGLLTKDAPVSDTSTTNADAIQSEPSESIGILHPSKLNRGNTAMVSILKNYFNPTSILDIGANVGQFYIDSKLVYPNAYYYLVEPNPQCKESLDSLNVEYYLGALSDKISTKEFLISKTEDNCTGNSFYRENTRFFSDENIETLQITTDTLDNYFIEKLKIQRFDLIKMDTQGSELDILKGGKEIISRALGIILEVSVSNYNIGAPTADEVFEYMSELGFTRKEKLGENFNPETHELVHEDYLFINNSSLQ